MDDMTNEEIAALIQAGTDREKNLELLWTRNIRLTRMIIHRLTGIGYQDDNFQDLEQQAYIGFHEAVMTYDPASGAKLFTHAENQIKKAIYRYHDNEGYLIRRPAYMKARMKKYFRVKARLDAESNGAVSTDAVLKFMNLTPNAEKALIKVLLESKTDSLNEPLKEDEENGTELLEMISSNEDIEAAAIEKEYQKNLHSLLTKALNTVSKQQREMIVCIYYQGFTFERVGRLFRCWPQNVWDQTQRAFKKIRSGSYGKQLVEFLPDRASIRAEEKIKTDLENMELTEDERGLLL